MRPPVVSEATSKALPSLWHFQTCPRSCISPQRVCWAAGKPRWQRPAAWREGLHPPGTEAGAEQVTETCHFPSPAAIFAQQRTHGRLFIPPGSAGVAN